MKKYIASILIASIFLIGIPFAITKASDNQMSIKDFINLLITIGVISPDKIPAVNAFLATVDANTVATSTITNVRIPSISTTTEDVYINIDDNSANVPYKGSTTINWTSNASQGCDFSQKNGSSSNLPYIKTVLPTPTYNLIKPKAYSTEVGNLVETTFYVISCTGLGGTVIENYTVNVAPPPPQYCPDGSVKKQNGCCGRVCPTSA